VAVVAFALAIAEMVVCAVLLVIFGLNMNKRVMRQSGAWLNILMLSATFILALSQLLLCFGRTDALCTIDLYFFRFGLSLLLCGLVFKNYRIYRIFCNKTATPLSITETSLTLKIFILIGAYMLFITVFVAVFGYDAIVVQSTKNRFYYYVICKIPSRAWDVIFQVLLELFILFLIVISLILAWLTRNAGAEYRESTVLATFSGVVAISFVIFFSLARTLSDDSDAQIFRFVIQVEFLSLIVLAAIVLLFLPKVVLLYKDNVRQSRSISRQSHLSELNQ